MRSSRSRPTRGRTRTSRTPTARTRMRSASAWCRTWAAPDSSTTACRSGPTFARSRCCAKCSPTTPGSRTSPSPWRASRPFPSRSPGPPSRRSATCVERPPARRSGRFRTGGGGHQRLHRRGPRSRRLAAHRHRGAAPHGHGPDEGRPRRAARRAGPGLQAGDARPGHLSHHGRRCSPRLRAPRARRIPRQGAQPQHVRPDPRRLPDDAGEARRHGDRHRRGGAAHVSLGVEEGHGRGARGARGRDGEDVRHRVGAARGRRGGADLRRARGDARPPGGEALPRGSRAAHLRGCDRSPEDRYREGSPEMTRYTAHVDTFARDNLPPTAAWPELLFELPELQYAGRLNCATELLDKPVTRGYGHRIALRTPDGECSYTQLFTQANRIANVLVRSMGLKPGNRVLLRGPNNPMMAACWFAVMKAGGICVATMPLLRAKELTEIIQKAEVSHALCDKRLEAELSSAAAACPTLKQLSYWHDDAPDALDALSLKQPLWFNSVPTAAEDVALIAFTSGTTGKPKGTLHFHRDVVAMCDAFPRSILRTQKDDIFCGTPPIAFTFGLGGVMCFPMRHGASTVLVEKHTPETLLETIERFKATVCFSAPTMYRQMAALARDFDLSSLKRCVSAGEALPDATRELFREATGIEIIDGIGSTEMIHIFISHLAERARRNATGYAIPGYRATVLDEEGRVCAPGTVGRLAVKGPTGCRYLADERQKDYVQKGWNITGDAYLMDEDGYFFYQARTDDMIISAGYNIAGPEVKGALLAHPAVAECAVVGTPDAERGTIVKAFVVLKKDVAKEVSMVKALQEHVKHAIAHRN